MVKLPPSWNHSRKKLPSHGNFCSLTLLTLAVLHKGVISTVHTLPKAFPSNGNCQWSMVVCLLDCGLPPSCSFLPSVWELLAARIASKWLHSAAPLLSVSPLPNAKKMPSFTNHLDSWIPIHKRLTQNPTTIVFRHGEKGQKRLVANLKMFNKHVARV